VRRRFRVRLPRLAVEFPRDISPLFRRSVKAGDDFDLGTEWFFWNALIFQPCMLVYISMTMPVMDIGEMHMTVVDLLMPMRMGMGIGCLPAPIMGVLMMLIVLVLVIMDELVMEMLVGM